MSGDTPSGPPPVLAVSNLIAPQELPDLICATCEAIYPVVELAWRCRCGGLLDVVNGSAARDPRGWRPGAVGLWRYHDALPIDVDPRISLGEGQSPLVASGRIPGVSLKLDFLMPTLSFKDRGAVVLATLARRLGVERAVLDSSGNAGTSMAAYFTRAGIECTVLVPAGTSAGKLAQMRAHRANVELVPGDRASTARAALDLADQPGVMYASHVFHPYFLHGVKTYGYEIWEQYGGRLPDTVVVPVGNGTMVLGCILAFEELVRAGLAEAVPTLIAVQSAGCAPLAAAMSAAADEPLRIEAMATIAEGIAVSEPPRGRQILAAIRATGGEIVTVTEREIAEARQELAVDGLFVEPTSAVCWAAVRHAHSTTRASTSPEWERASAALTAERVVVPLCGAGLKSPAPSEVAT